MSAPTPAPEGPPAAVPSPAATLAAAPLPDAQAAPARPELARPVIESPEQKLRNAELDALLAPAGPAERFPQSPATWSAQAPPAQAEYAATAERGLTRTDLLIHADGPREKLPPGTALPPRTAPETTTPELAPDAGTGKPENDPIPVLIARLSLPDPRTRARAADELGKRGAAAGPAVRSLRGALKARTDECAPARRWRSATSAPQASESSRTSSAPCATRKRTSASARGSPCSDSRSGRSSVNKRICPTLPEPAKRRIFVSPMA